MAQKKGSGAGKNLISLKAKPDNATIKLARQNGFKTKMPKKKRAKTEDQAKRFESTWNSWVDNVNERAANQRSLNAANQKIGAL